MHVLNYLQDRPPWCCFAPDRAQVGYPPCLIRCHPEPISKACCLFVGVVWWELQEKAAKQCLEQQDQRAGSQLLQQQQQSPKGSCPEAAAALEPTRCPEHAMPGSYGGRSCEQGASTVQEHLAGTLPLFRIPGLALVLPTTAGQVNFAPLFLSKEQLDITWVRCSCLCTSHRNPVSTRVWELHLSVNMVHPIQCRMFIHKKSARLLVTNLDPHTRKRVHVLCSLPSGACTRAG